MPLFVPPRLRMSTPLVSSNRLQPRKAAAWYRRAPSMCTYSPCSCARSKTSFNSVNEYTVPYSVGWVMESTFNWGSCIERFFFKIDSTVEGISLPLSDGTGIKRQPVNPSSEVDSPVSRCEQSLHKTDW